LEGTQKILVYYDVKIVDSISAVGGGGYPAFNLSVRLESKIEVFICNKRYHLEIYIAPTTHKESVRY